MSVLKRKDWEGIDGQGLRRARGGRLSSQGDACFVRHLASGYRVLEALYTVLDARDLGA